MALSLPDLDTGRFPALADDARAAIPRWSSRWTDHNVPDPGITLTELVAAEVDRLMYEVNRVTDRDVRTLLRLVGFEPRPPVPASGAVSFRLAGAMAAPRVLPAGLELAADVLAGGEVPLVLRHTTRVGRSALRAVLSGGPDDVTDITRAVLNGTNVAAIGDDPSPRLGSALWLGLAPAPDPGHPLHIGLRLTTAADVPAAGGTAAAEYVWEAFDGSAWHALDAVDGTAGLTRTGRVELHIATVVPQSTMTPVDVPLAWVRCRLSGSMPDVAPRVCAVALHAGEVVQARPAVSRWSPSDAAAAGVVSLAGGDPLTAPTVGQHPVDVYESAGTSVLFGGVQVGVGERRPHQLVRLPHSPVVAGSVVVSVVRRAGGAVQTEAVELVADFDRAGPHATAAVLDAGAGTLVFGDGRHGRMLSPDESVFAEYEHTLAAAGNLRIAARCRIDARADSVNRGLLGESPAGVAATVSGDVAWPVQGGTDAEPPAQAAGRAARRLAVHERLLELMPDDAAVTLDGLDPGLVRACDVPERATTGADLERITLATPGRVVARCRAFAEVEAGITGVRAAGTATVVVIPALPRNRPEPSAGLLAAVAAELEQRRLVGSRILVSGPTYVEVSVRAKLILDPKAPETATLAAARTALDDYLHPLVGGSNRRGWPFGRDIYRADVLGVLDGVAGVADVESLELLDHAGRPTCGNVCVPATALVAAGDHQLQWGRP